MTETDDLRHYAIEVKPIGAACNLRCEYCYYLGKNTDPTPDPGFAPPSLRSPIAPSSQLPTWEGSAYGLPAAGKAAATPHPCRGGVPEGRGGVSNSLMSDEVLESYIRQVISIHGRYAEIEFAWHGGEPTLCGIPFFERAMALQRKYGEGRRILNTLQTNGTLLTDDWCRFFRDHHFRIGLSIDGPEHLHNIYRKDAHGEGSFARTMHGLELLRKHGVEFNTLTTVNAANAAHAKEVYAFLREFSDFMQFLPVVESVDNIPLPCRGGARGGVSNSNVALPPGLYSERHGRLAPFSVPAEAYGKFLCTILDEWARHKDVGRKFVQVFEATLGNMTRRPAGLCVHEAVCGHCGVIEKNGDLYRCDRYVFPEYRIGNILDAPLYDMMQTNRHFGEYKLDSLPPVCLHCDVADLCFGGCPKDRLDERLTLATPHPCRGGVPEGQGGVIPVVERRNYLCPGYRLFFRYFRQRIPKLINLHQKMTLRLTIDEP